MRQRKVVWVRSSHEKVMLLREKSQRSCLQSQEGKQCERSSSKASPSRPRWAKEKKNNNIQTSKQTSTWHLMGTQCTKQVREQYVPLFFIFPGLWRRDQQQRNSSSHNGYIFNERVEAAQWYWKCYLLFGGALEPPKWWVWVVQRGPSIWWGWYKWSKGAATGEQGRLRNFKK